MIPSSYTTEPLTFYDRSASSPSSSPERVKPHLGTNQLPQLSRTPSQTSALSCNSSSELVHHDSPNAVRETSLFDRWFGRKAKRKKLQDSEKNEVDPFDQEKGSNEPPPNSQPPRKLRFWEGWRLILLGSWLHYLILLIPGTWILNQATTNAHTWVFVFCILSMIPLVKLHDLATKELCVRLGGSKTGLLNASMANLVETVVAISALRKCELRVVQSSLIGSMLSKLLVVMGMCFFAGGLRFTEQDFDSTATQIHSSLLSISVGAVLLPAAFHFALTYSDEDALEAGTTLEIQKRDLLRMSRGVSIILIFIYASYLLFQFWSHTHLFKDNTVASNKLPNAVSVRSITSKIRSKSGLSQAPTRLRPRNVSKTRVASPTKGDANSIYAYANRSTTALSTYSRSNSPLPKDVTSSPRTLDAYLISSASPSDQTLRTITPPPGATVRLVQMPVPSMQRQRSLDSYSSRRWSANEEQLYEHRQGRDSDVDQVISTYMSDMGTVVEPPPPWEEKKYHDQARDIGEDFDRGQEEQEDEREDAVKEETMHKPKEPKMSWTLTLMLLTIITVLVAINADLMVESMDHLSPTISKQWIGLILLPTVGSIAECVTAMSVSVKDQLTLSISVAIGSTIQTALLVIPFMVLLGWVIDKPLALLFDPFQSVVLYISVHTMGYVVADGRSNWLEGLILVSLYVVIAVTSWFYPGSSFSTNLAICSTSTFKL
ncbi:Ca(2+):cation antiporter (CaCA) family protein [Abortiporus biennis]